MRTAGQSAQRWSRSEKARWRAVTTVSEKCRVFLKGQRRNRRTPVDEEMVRSDHFRHRYMLLATHSSGAVGS